jgi:oligosaccharyltransferase complex subunit delta (ribophorin II)
LVPKGSSIDLSIATEGDNSNRAHQTVAILSAKELGLDISYPFSVRVSGKGKLSIPLKSIPELFLSDRVGKLSLELAVGGFGYTEQEDTSEEEEEDAENEKVKSAKPKRSPKQITKNIEPLLIKISDNISIANKLHYPREASPKRFGIKPEIHHIFRADPRQVNATFASLLVFVGITSTVLFLAAAWIFFVGVDLVNLAPALKASGLAHAAFLLSIGAIEYTFFQYYKGVSIFDTIKSLAIIAPASVYFGSRALREVKARRLAGK